MKIYEALRQLLLGYGKFQLVAYQSLNWMERSGMAGGLAVKGEGSEFYVYWCLLGEISTGILQYKNLPSLTDMTFPAKKDSTWLGDVLVMYQNLTFKNSSPGDCPPKNKLHFRLLRHCSCAGCVSATFSSPDPVPSPPWSKLAATIDLYPLGTTMERPKLMVFHHALFLCSALSSAFPWLYIYITKTEKWNNQQWVFASPKSTSWAPHLKKVQFPVSSVNDEKYPLPGIALVRFHPKARNAWKNFGRVMALWRDPSAPWE